MILSRSTFLVYLLQVLESWWSATMSSFWQKAHSGKMTKRPPTKINPGPVIGLLAFVGFMSALPILLSERHKRLTGGVPMIASDVPLTPAQVRRGPYLNTGSKDAGADPDWQWQGDGGITYKGMKPKIVDESKPYAGIMAGKDKH